MKQLLAFPVRNAQFTVLLFVLLIVVGVTSWTAIPRGEDPQIDFPIFMIVVGYPGAGPADLERLVVRDLEESLSELERVTTIESRTTAGSATVRIEFEAGEDPDQKYDEVLRQMNTLRPTLPSGLTRFSVIRSTMLDVIIAQLALVSETRSFAEMSLLTDELADRLRAATGVRTAEVWGAPDRQVHVILDQARLAELGLPPSDVIAAISAESADLPAGAVEASGRRFVVRSSGSYLELGEVARTVVRATPGQLVRVGDVADVRWGYADQTYRARYNGERAVFVTVTQRDGYRVDRVRDAIWTTLDEFEATLPADLRLERGFDQARNVDMRLSRLQKDFMIALGMVLIMLIPLGLRAAGIVMVSIPLSLAIGVALLHLTGFTINQLSIVGAVIALGLLVDDSIVVVENITRFLRQGYSRVEAAIQATQQIAVAVVGATLTLVLAFVPLLVLPGTSGDYIRSLPVAVIYIVMASLLVSLVIIPFLASRTLSKHEKEGGGRVLQAFEGTIRRTYAPVLDRALGRPLTTLAIAAVLVAGSFLLIPVIGFSLFPKAETPQFYVDITAPEGSSLDVADDAARFGEAIVLARAAVQGAFTSVGHDNPRVYYNVYPRRDDPLVGQLFVTLHEYDSGHTTALLDSLRAELETYPGARLELKEFQNGPLIEAPVAFRVFGADLDSLRWIAAEVERVLESTPGTQYVTNPARLQRTELSVAIDREKAGLLGIPTVEVDRALRMALEGLGAGVLREPDGQARDIVVRLSEKWRPGPDILDQIQVASIGGALIPLRQIAGIDFQTDAPEIVRYDRERAVTLTSSVRTGFNTDRVTRDALASVEQISLPSGYRIEVAGEFASRSESFGGASNAIIVALFGILAILVLEFGSFRSMLIVASVIPLGAMGGLVALFLTGNTLSFTATIGFVALIGIEIKTSILLVDFTNQLRSQGVPLDPAIRRAGEVRFLPILLTSMTAIGGLLPLALARDALYAPLAWVIIGGLVTSTLLGRVVTPVVYKLIAPPVAVTAHAAA